MLGLLIVGSGKATTTPGRLELLLVHCATSNALHRCGIRGFARPLRAGESARFLPLPNCLRRDPQFGGKTRKTNKFDYPFDGVDWTGRGR